MAKVILAFLNCAKAPNKHSHSYIKTVCTFAVHCICDCRAGKLGKILFALLYAAYDLLQQIS
jgi:hypothetical protein